MDSSNRISKEEIERLNKMTPQEIEEEYQKMERMQRDLLEAMRKADIKP